MNAKGPICPYLIQLSYECGLKPSGLRLIIYQTLKVLPDKQNWSERPNIHDENVQLLEQCKWFKVYDVIEWLDDYFGTQARTDCCVTF